MASHYPASFIVCEFSHLNSSPRIRVILYGDAEKSTRTVITSGLGHASPTCSRLEPQSGNWGELGWWAKASERGQKVLEAGRGVREGLGKRL